jgi:hypothetical protein
MDFFLRLSAIRTNYGQISLSRLGAHILAGC